MNILNLSIENLLKPIASENSCGIDITYDSEFLEIKSQMKESESFNKGIWKEKDQKEKNLEELLLNCINLFSKKSKNLSILLFIFDLQCKLYGLYGIYDSLLLIKLSFEKYWDEIYPLDELNNSEIKKRYLYFLDKKISNYLKLGLFKQIKNIESIDYKQFYELIKNEKILNSEVLNDEKAIELIKKIEKCAEIINELTLFFNKKYNNIDNYFINSIPIFNHIIKLINYTENIDSNKNKYEENNLKIEKTYSVNNRDSIYDKILLLSKELLDIDPHSPVPLLIMRALECKDKNFVEILSTFFYQNEEINNIVESHFGNKNENI